MNQYIIEIKDLQYICIRIKDRRRYLLKLLKRIFFLFGFILKKINEVLIIIVNSLVVISYNSK